MKTLNHIVCFLAAVSISHQAHAFRIDLGVVEVSNEGMKTRTPEEIVHHVVTNANPAAIIEKGAEIIENNTGGDVSKLAGDLRREAGNATDTMGEMATSALAVTELAIQDPKRGLPRLMACSTTACLSEVQAKRQMRDQETALRAEREAQLNQAKSNMTAEQRSILEANYQLVQTRLSEVTAQAEAFKEAVVALVNIETAIAGRVDMAEETRALVAQISHETNQQLLMNYIRHLAAIDPAVTATNEFAAAGLQLEADVAASAQAASLTVDEFLLRVSEGLSDAQCAEISSAVETAKLAVSDIYSYLEADRTTYETELQSLKSALGIQ